MKVAIIKDDKLDYCQEAPFHPREKYQEYPFEDVCEDNPCYGLVRDLFYKLGMDRDHYGMSSWNPMGEIIRPGDHVFIKPNFVSHQNAVGGMEAIVVQGPIIRAVLDYVYIALGGKGKITIGDASYINADFDAIVRGTGIERIIDYYSRHMKIGLLDLRKEKGTLKDGTIIRQSLAGDPLGYSAIDLKRDSEHHGKSGYGRYRVAYYDRREMAEHHDENKNEYCIANSILDADVIINMPKLKTHDKTGFSCALKNLVGINGLKGWLPHHRAGPYEAGGDEYLHKDLRKDLFVVLKDELPVIDGTRYALPVRLFTSLLSRSGRAVPFRDDFEAGSWYGNSTLPRTIADMNKIIFYADKKGIMRDEPQRRMFIVVDGIIAGEKEGPMSNSAKKCGVLAAGYNPVEVDLVCCLAMGFDPKKILMLEYAMNARKYEIYGGSVNSIEIASDRCRTLDSVYDAFNCALAPPKSWIGHIEYEKSPPARAGTHCAVPASRQ
jgi:uncharacterized protein (DUF362 family)